MKGIGITRSQAQKKCAITGEISNDNYEVEVVLC